MGLWGLFPLKIVGPTRVMIAGSFVTVDGSDPTTVYGNGFTVARTAEGIWTVTLDTGTSVVQFDSIVCFPFMETETLELAHCWGLQDDTDTNSFVITLEVNANTDGAATAADDDAGTVINFIAIGRTGNFASD